MDQLLLDPHPIYQDHPALSAVPTPPGPQLDPSHHRSSDHDVKTSSALPPPPLFSPPSYNHSTMSDDKHHHHDTTSDISFFHSSNPTTDLDLDLESSQDNSIGRSMEPKTPEPIVPNLSFINFITGQTPSLSLDTMRKPEDKIRNQQEEEQEINRPSLEPSVVFERDGLISNFHHNPLVDQASLKSPVDQESLVDCSSKDSMQREKPSVGLVAHESVASNHVASELLPLEQLIKSSTQNGSDLHENWLDFSKPEFQFASGLFLVPWTTVIISSRLLNELSILIFCQPVLNPMGGLLTSIFAPSLLYSSLILLFVTSLDHHI